MESDRAQGVASAQRKVAAGTHIKSELAEAPRKSADARVDSRECVLPKCWSMSLLPRMEVRSSSRLTENSWVEHSALGGTGLRHEQRLSH